MKAIYKLVCVASCVALGFFSAGCDFQAAEDAFNDIGVVIELPPINTTASIQILDAATMSPISQEVTLTFSGAAGSKVVDTYSDPITELKVRGGFVSFGLDNSVVPSEAQPAEFVVTAKASGYGDRVRTLQVEQTGLNSFVMRLLKENPTGSSQGAAGQRQSVATNPSTGATTQPATVSTPPTTGTQTTAQVTIPQGTVALKADGTPITGQLVTDLRVFESSAEGFDLLPEDALKTPDGKTLVVAGALSIKVWNPQTGEVAASLTSTGGAGKSGAIECVDNEGNPGVVASFTVPSDFADIVAGETALDVIGYNPVQKTSAVIGTAELDGTTASFCYQSLNYEPLQPIDSEIYYTVGLEGGATQDAGATVTVKPNGNSGNITLEVRAPGVSRTKSKAIPQDGSDVVFRNQSGWANALPVTFTYNLVASTEDGTSTALPNINPFSGSYTLTLPASEDGIDVTLEVVAECSGDLKVPLVGDLSGLVVVYREKGNTTKPYKSMSVSVETSSTAFERATGTMKGVLAGTSYEVLATLGTSSDSRTVTPKSDGEVIRIGSDEVNRHCQ